MKIFNKICVIVLLLAVFISGRSVNANGLLADTAAPTVSFTNPPSGAIDVAINQKIAITFSEAMKASTITKSTFLFKRGTKIVSGKVSYVGVTAIFTPYKNLKPNTKYTVTIKTKAKDLAGNKLASRFVWSFTTGADTDVTAPTVSSTIPDNTATGAVKNIVVNATFSEEMDPSTISKSTFKLKQGMVSISGKVKYSGLTAKFTPSSELEPNTVYTATITTKAKDLAGNKLASNFVWSFTTGTETGRLPVDIGLAGNYAILAKSGISTTGSTLITGDIGVSPIDSTPSNGFGLILDASAITGFGLIRDASHQFATSSLVVGKVYAAYYAGPTLANLTTAVSSMKTAYTDAAGRTLPDATELGAGEIGGMTIVPGLYKWSSGVFISEDIILNGGPEDVWIFQIAEDLILANGKSVILSGEAQAKNIFWQVAGGVGVEIGTAAHMEGIVLAQNAIHMRTDASWNGRALAQTGVSLNANAITKPGEEIIKGNLQVFDGYKFAHIAI